MAALHFQTGLGTIPLYPSQPGSLARGQEDFCVCDYLGGRQKGAGPGKSSPIWGALPCARHGAGTSHTFELSLNALNSPMRWVLLSPFCKET